MRVNLKENKAITLVTLVITMVLLLILSGVSVSMVTNDDNDGVLDQAVETKLTAQKSQAKSAIETAIASSTSLSTGKLDVNKLHSQLEALDMEVNSDGLPMVIKTADGLSFEIDSRGAVNALSGLILSAKSIKILAGGEATLEATILEEAPNSEAQLVQWESTNSDIITVEDGVVRANAGAIPGASSEIIATYGEASVRCKVTIVQSIEGCTIENIKIVKGNIVKVTLPVTNAEEVVFTSPNEDVVKVDGKGRLIAVGAGEVEITVTGVLSNESVTFNVKVAEHNEITIMYDLNGGQGAIAPQTKIVGTSIRLSSVEPTAEHRAFLGWSLERNSNTVDYTAGAIFSKNVNTTLYAVWGIRTYTITFDANGGSGGPATQSGTYGESYILNSSTPTKTGYTFSCWTTNNDGTGDIYTGGQTYTLTGDMTLHAKWTLNTYTITFNANGGTGGPGTQTITYGVSYELSSTEPTRSGYTFTGWNTESNGSGDDYTGGTEYTRYENYT